MLGGARGAAGNGGGPGDAPGGGVGAPGGGGGGGGGRGGGNPAPASACAAGVSAGPTFSRPSIVPYSGWWRPRMLHHLVNALQVFHCSDQAVPMSSSPA